MAKIKMNPFTYKGLKVKLLVDLTDRPPFDNQIIAPAGTIVEVQKTIGYYHYVHINGRSFTAQVKIDDTELTY